jgi:RHS repeat-associated protein
MGRFSTISPTGSGTAFQYSYDAASNETQRYNFLNGGVTQIYTRDALNRMSQRDVKKGATTLSSEVYGFDAMSRLTSVDREDSTSDVFTYYRDGELNTAQYNPAPTPTPTPTPVPTPAPPTASAATNVTSSGFTAHWGSVSNATGYRFDVSTSSTFASYVTGYQNLDVGNVTSRAVSGLVAGTTYYYRVRAYNGGGTSGNSNVISVTTTTLAQVATPTFSPGGGLYCAHSVNVTISTTTTGASIRYTTDGSTPTSTHGTAIANGGTATVSGIDALGVTLQAMAYKSGMTDSTVHSDTYTYDCGQAPVLGPPPDSTSTVEAGVSPADSSATLLATASTQRSVTYNLDKAGNRTSLVDTGVTKTYSPNTLNQYTAAEGTTVTNGSEHEIASYQGNSYTYINDERLSSVNGTAYTLGYDALGRCVKRTLNGVLVYYIYDGEKPILEYNSAGGGVGHNLYGKAIDEILMRIDYTINQTYYFQQDHEGSVTHLTNPSGVVIESYRYDAFGAPTTISSSGTYNNRFLFTGREYSATFSFYEYRARAYNPTLGRFMSEDPKGFAAGDYNLFRYCHNDPEDLTDPTGTDYGPFDSADQAYRFFDAKYNATSIRENREYRVEIYQGTGSGKFYTTDASKGSGDTAKQAPILVKDSKYAGVAHSHGDWSKGFVDEKGKQHIESRARNPHEDSFKSGEPSKQDRETAKNTTVYTSTPAREGWKQGPGDKEPQRVTPMRDPNDKPATDSNYPRLTPQDVQNLEKNWRIPDYPPFQPH